MYTTRPVITGKRGVVAAGHYLAAQAGIKMFAKGGNAVDAGVAAGFALAVLKPHQNSLGGECPILIYSPVNKNVVAISGQGTAPGKATLQWFRENEIDIIPGDGFLGATVPGMFGSYCTALLKYGRLALTDVLEPAVELAEKGFPMYKALRDCIANQKTRFTNEWPSSAEVFIPGGKIPGLGEVLKQPALAGTLKKFFLVESTFMSEGREKAIERSIDYFYKIEISRRILKFAKSNPVRDVTGKYHTTLLEKEDFNSYSTKIESPVFADYRNYRMFKCGPWTQGPVFLQQLKLLEGFNLNKMAHNSGEYIHLVVESSKMAFADRDRYYGDPAFSDIPLKRLLSEEYNEEKRKEIDLNHANNQPLWELQEDIGDEAFKGDTTHLDVIDDEGFMISATPSGGWIPSSPVIPETGFPLGTRAQVFNLQEGHPNCLHPYKRPRTTLTPSISFKNGEPWMAFGTPGGDMQDQWTLQYFLNIVEFGMDMQQAMDAPSFHTTHFINSFYPHNTQNGTIFVEQGVDTRVLYDLQARGHKLHLLPPDSNGQVCAAALNHDTGMLEGAASFKEDGQAYAFGW